LINIAVPITSTLSGKGSDDQEANGGLSLNSRKIYLAMNFLICLNTYQTIYLQFFQHLLIDNVEIILLSSFKTHKVFNSILYFSQ